MPQTQASVKDHPTHKALWREPCGGHVGESYSAVTLDGSHEVPENIRSVFAFVALSVEG